MKKRIRHFRKEHEKFKAFIRQLSIDRVRRTWCSRCNGVTLVIISDDDVEAEGYAFCHPRDQFTKKTGVMIAEGRAKKKFEQLTNKTT